MVKKAKLFTITMKREKTCMLLDTFRAVVCTPDLTKPVIVIVLVSGGQRTLTTPWGFFSSHT